MSYTKVKRGMRILILFPLFLFYKIFKRNESETIVLMYHSVSSNGDSLAVKPQSLEKQIAYLKNKNYRFITTAELLRIVHGEVDRASKNILLTFDDGYKDFITAALPILKKFSVPAALFIHTNRSSENLGNETFLMGWDEIRELNGTEIEIGNHSHLHLDMKKLSSEELSAEIRISGEILKKELGYAPQIFAYPGGKYNDQVAGLLGTNGYKASFTIDEGVVSKKDNPMKIKRIGIGRDMGMLEFKLITTRAFAWYQSLRKFFGLRK